MHRRTGPDARRSAAKSSHRPDRNAATGRWSAWSAHAFSTGHRRPGSWPRHSWHATAWLRPGSSSAPIRWRLNPGDFRAAGDGVGADARAVLALPAEALILEGAAFRVHSDQRRIAGTVRLAEGVAAGNQGDGFFVIHRHAEECFADVLGRRDGVRIAVRPFRIDVDEAHLHGAERFGELAFAAVAFIAEPGALGPPVEF